MVWVVWGGVALLLAVLLGVSYWMDADARRRGAQVKDSRVIARANRSTKLSVLARQGQILNEGATPRTQDSATKHRYRL